MNVLHGSRALKLEECRSIARTLRQYCINIFPNKPGDDPLPRRVSDKVRYVRAEIEKKRIRSGIHAAGGSGDIEPPSKKVKRVKEVYLVNKTKYHSTATQEELAGDLEEELTNTEDGHRILQAKIR